MVLLYISWACLHLNFDTMLIIHQELFYAATITSTISYSIQITISLLQLANDRRAIVDRTTIQMHNEI